MKERLIVKIKRARGEKSMTKVMYAKHFLKCLIELRNGGSDGNRAAMKSLAACAEAGVYGEIKVVRHTDHGETRVARVEKYNLGGGYRLIVQLNQNTRVFLFAGTHEKTESWLKTHENYEWVARDSDGKINFVPRSTKKPAPIAPAPGSPPSLCRLPLLQGVSEKDWALLNLPADVREYWQKVTRADWEAEPEIIFDHVANLGGGDCACLMLDLFQLADRGDWESFIRCIERSKGVAHAASEGEVAIAMVRPVNSEDFITWEDSNELPPDQPWADWMLFLHPDQKKLVKQELNGAARLRGVSGSGKTSVMVHRARCLAKKYSQRILVVTLTESMRKLLDNLLRSLCGVEAAHIKTFTVNSLATHIIRDLHPKGETWYTMATREKLQDMEKEAVHIVSEHPDFPKTPLSKLNGQDLRRFVVEEIEYVRGRLPKAEFDSYPTRGFRRSGRMQSLGESGRRICLQAIRYWNQELSTSHVLDFPEIIQTAWELVSANGALSEISSDSLCRPRCVLVDEVQDLCQLEVRLLGHLVGATAGTPPDGIKPVGATPFAIEPEPVRPPSAPIVPQATVMEYVVLLKNEKGVLNQRGPKYATKAEADKAALGYPYPPFGPVVVQPVNSNSKLPVIMPVASTENNKAQQPAKPATVHSVPSVPPVQPAIANGLFLVGDGAQAIYKRGFSLSKIGINIGGRSWVMKKNYRNTFQVLKAAYGLIESYPFVGEDEDNMENPLEPDYAPRRGEQPFIVHCQSQAEEFGFVASQIQILLEHYKLLLGQICVIGLNSTVRDALTKALEQAKLSCIELREDADPETNKVKISTIESSKGHEFSTVFIVGLIEGAMPRRSTPPEEKYRDAARLYVAMTRARDRLYLTYNTQGNAHPSTLLSSIQHNCSEFKWIKQSLLPVTKLIE
jgi:superfamily I DNA/RNA helicase